MWGLTAIILLILKWLGILLLAVIGIVLVLAVCILFVPVRYHVYIEKQGQLVVRGYASWLFHFLHLSFQLKEGKKSHTPRILGIPLAGRKKGKKRQTVRKSRHGKSSRKKPEENREKGGDSRKEPEKARESSWKEPEEAHKSSEDGRKEPDKNREDSGDNRKGTEERQKDSESGKSLYHSKIFQRIQEFFLRIRRVLGKIRKGFGDFRKSVTEGKGRESDSMLAKAGTILSDDNTLQLWRLVWGNLTSLWRHSRPRKFVGWVHFGTSDPCVTGQILGAVGVAYAMVGNGVRVVPDFENAVLEGCLEMKGRIQMVHLLFVLKRVFFSSEWKHFKSQIG